MSNNILGNKEYNHVPSEFNKSDESVIENKDSDIKPVCEEKSVSDLSFDNDVIVIGAGITGLTTAFHLIKSGKKVHILEKEKRIGGQIKSYKEKGFTFESGPNTGTLSNPDVVELFESLAPDCELERACKKSKVRLIW